MIFNKTQPSTMIVQRGRSYFLKPTSNSSGVMKALDDQRRRQNKTLCDVTLSVDGTYVLAHKAVLAACSSYFNQRFSEESNRQFTEFHYDNCGRFFPNTKQLSFPNSPPILSSMSPPLPKQRQKTISESSSENSTARSSSSSPVSHPSPSSVDVESSIPLRYSSFRKNEKVIFLPGVTLHGFRRLLDYMYTSELCINEDNIFDIILVSCLLQIRTVIEACRSVLSKEPRWKLVSPRSRQKKKRMFLSSWNSRQNNRGIAKPHYNQLTSLDAHVWKRECQKMKAEDNITFDRSLKQENSSDCNRISVSESPKNSESVADSNQQLNKEANLNVLKDGQVKTKQTSDKTISGNLNDKEMNLTVDDEYYSSKRAKVSKSCKSSETSTKISVRDNKPASAEVTQNAFSNDMRPKSNSAGPYLTGSEQNYESPPFYHSTGQRKCTNQRRSRTVSENIPQRYDENIALDLRQKSRNQSGFDTQKDFFNSMMSGSNLAKFRDVSGKEDIIYENKQLGHREMKRRHLRTNSDEAIHYKSRRFADEKQNQTIFSRESQLPKYSDNSSILNPMAASFLYKTPPFFQLSHPLNMADNKDFRFSYSTLMLPQNCVASPGRISTSGALPIYSPSLLYAGNFSGSEKIGMFPGHSVYSMPHFAPPNLPSLVSNLSVPKSSFPISSNSIANSSAALQQTTSKNLHSVLHSNEKATSFNYLRNSETGHVPLSTVGSPTALYNLSSIKHLRKRKLLMSTAMADSGTDTDSLELSSVDSGIVMDQRKERFRSSSLEDTSAKSPC